MKTVLRLPMASGLPGRALSGSLPQQSLSQRERGVARQSERHTECRRSARRHEELTLGFCRIAPDVKLAKDVKIFAFVTCRDHYR